MTRDELRTALVPLVRRELRALRAMAHRRNAGWDHPLRAAVSVDDRRLTAMLAGGDVLARGDELDRLDVDRAGDDPGTWYRIEPDGTPTPMHQGGDIETTHDADLPGVKVAEVDGPGRDRLARAWSAALEDVAGGLTSDSTLPDLVLVAWARHRLDELLAGAPVDVRAGDLTVAGVTLPDDETDGRRRWLLMPDGGVHRIVTDHLEEASR